jgi:hypothetical protein
MTATNLRLAAPPDTVGVLGLHVTIAQMILLLLGAAVVLIVGYRIGTRKKRFDGGDQ